MNKHYTQASYSPETHNHTPYTSDNIHTSPTHTSIIQGIDINSLDLNYATLCLAIVDEESRSIGYWVEMMGLGEGRVRVCCRLNVV